MTLSILLRHIAEKQFCIILCNGQCEAKGHAYELLHYLTIKQLLYKVVSIKAIEDDIYINAF